VMIGREAYHRPWSMARWDADFFGDDARVPADRAQVEAAMLRYMETLQAQGQPWTFASRHMLGLWNGTPGARKWRQVWSNHLLKNEPPAQVARLADAARRRDVPEDELLGA
jgi:tRNA-dihydrouridine synthase A